MQGELPLLLQAPQKPVSPGGGDVQQRNKREGQRDAILELYEGTLVENLFLASSDKGELGRIRSGPAGAGRQMYCILKEKVTYCFIPPFSPTKREKPSPKLPPEIVPTGPAMPPSVPPRPCSKGSVRSTACPCIW